MGGPAMDRAAYACQVVLGKGLFFVLNDQVLYAPLVYAKIIIEVVEEYMGN